MNKGLVDLVFYKVGLGGLTARLCRNEPFCRVKPVRIDGNADSDFSVTIFQEDGAILGAAVSDLDSLALVANVGETWDDLNEGDFVQKFDALTGEPMSRSGWTLTRRLDGQEWDFKSLTGILDALKRGTFGVQFVSSLDTLGEANDEAPFPDDEYDYLDAVGPNCPEATCAACPAPDVCDGLRQAERLPRGMEPLGWNAPELR